MINLQCSKYINQHQAFGIKCDALYIVYVLYFYIIGRAEGFFASAASQTHE
jgi:hypothetical protein